MGRWDRPAPVNQRPHRQPSIITEQGDIMRKYLASMTRRASAEREAAAIQQAADAEQRARNVQHLADSRRECRDALDALCRAVNDLPSHTPITLPGGDRASVVAPHMNDWRLTVAMQRAERALNKVEP